MWRSFIVSGVFLAVAVLGLGADCNQDMGGGGGGDPPPLPPMTADEAFRQIAGTDTQHLLDLWSQTHAPVLQALAQYQTQGVSPESWAAQLPAGWSLSCYQPDTKVVVYQAAGPSTITVEPREELIQLPSWITDPESVVSTSGPDRDTIPALEEESQEAQAEKAMNHAAC